MRSNSFSSRGKNHIFIGHAFHKPYLEHLKLKKIIKHIKNGYIAIGVNYIQVTHLFQNGYSCSSFACLLKVTNWFILLIKDVDIMHVLWPKKSGFACKNKLSTYVHTFRCMIAFLTEIVRLNGSSFEVNTSYACLPIV